MTTLVQRGWLVVNVDAHCTEADDAPSPLTSQLVLPFWPLQHAPLSQKQPSITYNGYSNDKFLMSASSAISPYSADYDEIPLLGPNGPCCFSCSNHNDVRSRHLVLLLVEQRHNHPPHQDNATFNSFFCSKDNCSMWYRFTWSGNLRFFLLNNRGLSVIYSWKPDSHIQPLSGEKDLIQPSYKKSGIKQFKDTYLLMDGWLLMKKDNHAHLHKKISKVEWWW